MSFNRRPQGPAPDPEEELTAACRTCGTVVKARRYQVAPPAPSAAARGAVPGMWQEAPHAECLGCGAKVYFTDFVYKPGEGYDPNGYGPRFTGKEGGPPRTEDEGPRPFFPPLPP